MTMERELLTNVTKKPATLPYPAEKTAPVEGMRAMVTWQIERCIGCNLCVQVCPSTAIQLLGRGPTSEITYHLDRCLFCGECVDVCPTHAIAVTAEYELAFFDRTAMTQTFRGTPPSPTPALETSKED